jgi:hypothetical protein
LVRTLKVVEVEIPTDAGSPLDQVVVGVQVDFLVLEGAPEIPNALPIMLRMGLGIGLSSSGILTLMRDRR